jgi:hypothetical protein
MLKSLDVLIGLVVIILALSMAVTVITQALTATVNSRGRHLRRGLADLLHLLDPALPDDIARELAEGVLIHPLVSASSLPLDWVPGSWLRLLRGARLGSVIQREELTKLLMALATADAGRSLSSAAQSTLTKILAANGIADPAATLKAVRGAALELERSSPSLSNSARQTAALLTAAQSDFVGKINSWFDQTMDRTAQRFTASTRFITFVGAFAVAFGLQVDTVMLYNRLSMDDVLRDELVDQARALPNLAAAPAGGALPNSESRANLEIYRTFLSEAGVISLPTGAAWRDTWSSISGGDLSRLGGILTTALLLSLGAPFWYGALQNLLKLRSVLAQKDDEQRKDRQTTGSDTVLKTAP